MSYFVVLVLNVCTLGGRPCHDVQFTYDDISVLQCQRVSQLAGAQWAVEHPGYYVRRSTCKQPGLEAKL